MVRFGSRHYFCSRFGLFVWEIVAAALRTFFGVRWDWDVIGFTCLGGDQVILPGIEFSWGRNKTWWDGFWARLRDSSGLGSIDCVEETEL